MMSETRKRWALIASILVIVSAGFLFFVYKKNTFDCVFPPTVGEAGKDYSGKNEDGVHYCTPEYLEKFDNRR